MWLAALLSILLSSSLISVHAEQVDHVGSICPNPEEEASFDTFSPPVPGSLGDRIGEAEMEHLKEKPRVVIGYVSDKDWSFVEFLCMTHSSWRYINAFERAQPYKWDILAFVHPTRSKEVAAICTPLDLQGGARSHWEEQWDPDKPQCHSVVYAPPSDEIWHGYPFINNVHYFANPLVASFLSKYGMAMKTDFDTFISPAWLHYWPERFMFGIQEYVVMDYTSERLQNIAEDLGLQHNGKHNLGPTWYGRVQDLIALAKFSIPIMLHIISKEFEQAEGGGIKQAWMIGEGFPQWNAGMAAMYATELAANHLFSHPPISTATMDEHGDSPLMTAIVHHIHCRHGDKDFSKFEFFRHHYAHIALGTLDPGIVKDYATFLAVYTWRQLQQAQLEGQKGLPP